MTRALVRAFLACGGLWFASALASSLVLTVTAGLTSRWGAARASGVVVPLLIADALLLGGAFALAIRPVAVMVPSAGARAAVLAAFAAVQLLTWLALGFVTLVVLNR